jgi:hypothetical protein
MHHYAGHEDAAGAKNFPIEEITVIGTRGEMKLAGELARTTFSEKSRALYVLAYK